PSYFVSSLDFSRSNRKVGSRLRAWLGCLDCESRFRTLVGRRGAGATALPKSVEPVVAAGAAALDELPLNQPANWVTISPTATTPRAAAAITLVLFSAPTFTTSSLNRFPF